MYDDIDYLSIPQIATEVGGSDNLVRRYSQRFPDFFSGRIVDGVMKYPPSTVEMVERIKSLYENGKSRTEIKDILWTQYPPPIDGKKGVTLNIAPSAIPKPYRDTVADIQKIIAGAITDAVQSLSDQKAEITELRTRLAELEAKMEKMSKNGNAKPKKRSWFRKLFGRNGNEGGERPDFPDPPDLPNPKNQGENGEIL